MTFSEMVVETAREGILVLDFDLRVERAGEAFCRLFGVSRHDAEGRSVFRLGGGRLDVPELRDLLQGMLTDTDTVTDLVIDRPFEGLGRRVLIVDARRFDTNGAIVLAVEDRTETRSAAEQLHRGNATLRERVNELERQVRDLTGKLARVEQQERRRISELLHDDVQQRIYGTVVRVGIARKEVLVGEKEKVLQCLASAEKWLTESIQVLRTLAMDLTSPTLRGQSLENALRWLTDHMKDLHGLEVDLTVDSEVDAGDETRVLAFQTVRELLFNVVKHAGTLEASVTLRGVADRLEICVSDDGAGFDPHVERSRERKASGFGLSVAQERLKMFGGSMTIDSAPGRGTEVVARIPLAP